MFNIRSIETHRNYFTRELLHDSSDVVNFSDVTSVVTST